MKRYLYILIVLIVASCKSDPQVEALLPPEISVEGDQVIYSVKVGQQVVITPIVENDASATYSWAIDGVEVSTEKIYSATFDTNCTVYLSLTVANQAGDDVMDFRIDVSPLSPPVIWLQLLDDSLTLLSGESYTFEPTITGQDVGDFECRWFVDGQQVSTSVNYEFTQSIEGEYSLRIEASNVDGTAEPFSFTVEVVQTAVRSVSFVQSSFFYSLEQRTALVGRPIFLSVEALNYDDPTYIWYIDGFCDDTQTSSQFNFTTTYGGTIVVEVVVSESDGSNSESAQIEVASIDRNQVDLMRVPTSQSSAVQSAVYEFIPAPGQYVGESAMGYTGAETTHQSALAFAEQRLGSAEYLSLGGFGGYIVVGFDHSIIDQDGDYDFAIYGNAFDGGSEPGVVWVMQDLNGNGLPDEEWYELRGSESGASTTLSDYSVTYFRPASQQSVAWIDSLGESGTVDYFAAYHSQDSYYPTWITSSSYTLRGTRLEPRNIQESAATWDNQSYDWGYADNFGEDQLTLDTSLDGSNQLNGFKIENAMLPDGESLELSHIDFIKVQVAVNSKSGFLGEISTEVRQFLDLSL